MKIGIVGGGIVGVSAGFVLAEAGHAVVIYARDPVEQTTSWAAAALAYPVNVEETPRVRAWYAQSLKDLAALEAIDGSGVSLVDWVKCTAKPVFDIPFWVECVDEYMVLSGADCPYGFRAALSARLHLMDVDVYYPYLLARFEAAGGRVQYQEIGALEDVAGDHDALVNCTGVWARDFVGDGGVHAARGQVVIVRNPGLTTHFTSFDSMTYMYPRRDVCLIGGSYDLDDWDMMVDEDLSSETIARAALLEPALADAEILDVRVGLRPLRVHVALDSRVLGDGTPVIDNYGHGGAGYTLSWGCARAVAKLIKTL